MAVFKDVLYNCRSHQQSDSVLCSLKIHTFSVSQLRILNTKIVLLFVLNAGNLMQDEVAQYVLLSLILLC